MCTSCKDPGLSGYLAWYSCVSRYVFGTGGPRADKTWMGTGRAGPVAAAAHSYGREKHTQGQSPRGDDGRRDTRTAGPIGLRVVATEHGGLACSRIAPACLGSLQGPTTYTASLERFRWSAALSAICVPAWPHRGDPRRDLGHGRPTQAGELRKKVPGSLSLCLVPECLGT